MNWRDIIHRYLNACRDDQLAGAGAETHAHRMLMSFGSTRLLDTITAWRADWERLAIQPLGPVEGYKLIEERQDVVVVEVERCTDGQPPFPSRFRLVQSDNSWRLDDIYWACYCEDGKCFSCTDGKCEHCSGGKCFHCDGKGYRRCWFFFGASCILCNGSGSCFLCGGKGTCRSCSGLGRCSSCASSDMPGWNSLYRRRPTDAEETA